MKRLFDILVAVGALLCLWPAMALTALAIRLESPGPVIYRQRRIGRRGQPFVIYKFRSMVVDAQKVGPLTTGHGDPRITKVGQILRKTGLDELPQIFNVLRGEMSLVGPRPEQPFQEADYSAEDWARRHRVSPGLTGLAQVNGRHDLSMEERLRLDLRYVRSPGLAMDMRVLILTLREVLLRGS
jgi:lipopolysaccharide/colanic/teichoic acid biosynthesis glycosyltransferase